MRIFNDVVGTIAGVETEERLTVCNNFLVTLADQLNKGIKAMDNNNQELATLLATTQPEIKKVKKILTENELIEIVKVSDLESMIQITNKGLIHSSTVKADKLKDAMIGTPEIESDDFVDPKMDEYFVETYNRLSYEERVVYEAVVAAVMCRSHYQSCYFRTLGSLLDGTAATIMPVLKSLEETGLITLVGERSTQIFLNNSKEFLMAQYSDFYNTGFVEKDWMYKAAFKQGAHSGYEFPNFEMVYPVEEDFGFEMEETVQSGEVVVNETPVVESTDVNHQRLFLIDTSSLPLEHFVQTVAPQVLTDKDYYVAVLSAANLTGPMSFTLFNQLMKLPCRGETDLVEETMIYYQVFTIKIMQLIQENPQSTIVVMTNAPSYPMILNQLRTKLKLREDQVQLMSLMA